MAFFTLFSSTYRQVKVRSVPKLSAVTTKPVNRWGRYVNSRMGVVDGQRAEPLPLVTGITGRKGVPIVVKRPGTRACVANSYCAIGGRTEESGQTRWTDIPYSLAEFFAAPTPSNINKRSGQTPLTDWVHEAFSKEGTFTRHQERKA